MKNAQAIIKQLNDLKTKIQTINMNLEGAENAMVGITDEYANSNCGVTADKNKELLYSVDSLIEHAIDIGENLLLKIDENVNKLKNTVK